MESSPKALESEQKQGDFGRDHKLGRGIIKTWVSPPPVTAWVGYILLEYLLSNLKEPQVLGQPLWLEREEGSQKRKSQSRGASHSVQKLC